MPAVPSQPVDTVDLGQLLDDSRWTGYQKWLVFLTALTIVFDGIDNQLLGVSIPAIMREWSVPRAALAPVVSLGYFGMMIGAALAGITGDRAGRRTALLGCIALFGAATLLSVLAHGTSALAVLFGLLTLCGGLINAVQTTMYALAANVYGSAMRATGIGLASGVGRSGAILSGYAGAWAIEYRGNLSYFGLMAAAMCVCFVMLAIVRRHVPASR